MTTTKIWIPAIFVAVLLVTGCQDKVLPGTADMPADPPVSGMPLDDPLPAPGGTGPDSASPDGRPDEDGKNDKFRQDPIEVSEADRPADESGSPTAHPRSAAENDALLPSEESEATDPGSPAPGKASGQEASEPG